MNNQGEKTQTQVERSSRMKTHTCYLKILSRKYTTNGVWKWEHEVFGKEIVEREDERSQKFEGKLKKI